VIAARTASVDATRALGAALAPLARPGDVVVLAGDLGAGKTAFTQGFARGLGVDDVVTSPTFTLVRTYAGRLPLHHLDVYRLAHLQEAEDLGVAEMVDGAVTLVEWGDAVRSVLPADRLEIELTFGDGDDDRRVDLAPVGKTWIERRAALAAAVEPWREGA
jgi:tRNA threonylcarbamoyladenosine biosynthesis protein TsaE